MVKKAVVFVDDELVLQSVKMQIKRNLGSRYWYECAGDEEEVWEVLDELHEDGREILLIVSDWLTLNMKGGDLLGRVHRKFPDITTVMLTGYRDAAIINRIRQQANLWQCLSKPWDEHALINIITLCLN